MHITFYFFSVWELHLVGVVYMGKTKNWGNFT